MRNFAGGPVEYWQLLLEMCLPSRPEYASIGEEYYPGAELQMDQKDRRVLMALQMDGRASNASLAKLLGMAEAPTWRRLRALETSGVVCKYTAILDRQKLGYEVMAFVSIRFATHQPDVQRAFENEVVKIPQVVWCHNVSGSTDFLLCAVARNLSEYGEFVSTKLRSLPGVSSIESSFSLKPVKEGLQLPL
jgi:Lrp/AsnC family leucine-responsive transcriptional regulator